MVSGVSSGESPLTVRGYETFVVIVVVRVNNLCLLANIDLFKAMDLAVDPFNCLPLSACRLHLVPFKCKFSVKKADKKFRSVVNSDNQYI